MGYGEYFVKSYHPYLTHPVVIPAWDGKINGNVSDGDYIYRVQARVDWEDASWQTLDFPVRVDTVPPVIDSLEYDKENGVITVQASDGDFSGIDYMLYEEPRGVIASSEEGVFDLNTLSAIPYQLKVMVRDAAGNIILSEPILTGTDSTAPVAYFESPRYRATYNNHEVVVNGYVVEANTLISLKVDGNEVDYSYNPEENRYEFEITITLPDGVHDLAIEAVDSAGNTNAYERQVFIDTLAPVIHITTGPPATVSSSTEKVSLVAIIDENMGELKVDLNGNVLYYKKVDVLYETEVLQPVHYEMPAQSISLAYGDNLITLQAKDRAGNLAVKEFHVKRLRPEEKISTGGSSSGGGGGGSSGGGAGSAAIPVSSTNSTTVSPDQQQTISTEGARVEVPEAAVGEQVKISVQQLSSAGNLPEQDRLLSHVYEFSKDKVGNFLKPVEIRMAFDPDKIDREMDEPVLCWFDEMTQQWVEVEDCELDWKTGEVIGRVDHFTRFAVLTRPVEKALEITDEKLISGYPDSSFRPQGNATRAEAVTVMAKIMK